MPDYMETQKTINRKMDWDEYFMQLARLASQRSSCRRRRVGAVAVVDRHVVATGYNGAPSGIPDCMELGECLREKLQIPSGERQELCRAVHAEQNLLCQAAKHGTSLDNAKVYITHQPCVTCAKLLANAGVKSIIYNEPYPDEYGVKILREKGVDLVRYSDLLAIRRPPFHGEF